MRNVFHQYSQRENQLTHALACTLDEDRKLLGSFLRWINPRSPAPPSARLDIMQQGVPGARIGRGPEDDSGIPDACIHHEDGWVLAIESKIQAPIKNSQLRRHVETLTRAGFEKPELLVISTSEPKKPLPDGMNHRTWQSVYGWANRQHARSEWARRFTRFMEELESDLIEEQYLNRGTLTMFNGIQFNEKNPYNYREARRQILLLGDVLQKDKRLKKLGIDPNGERRSSITGSGSPAVWDYIPLKSARKGDAHTSQPHLTMVIAEEYAKASITIPNNIKGGFKAKLKDIESDGFLDLLRNLEKNTRKVRRKSEESTIVARAEQRHFKSQSSRGIVDAVTTVNLETLDPPRSPGKIKHQPEWVRGMYEVLVNKKRANIQLSVGVTFPYSAAAIRKPQAPDLFVETWLGLNPLIDFAMNPGFPGRPGR